MSLSTTCENRLIHGVRCAPPPLPAVGFLLQSRAVSTNGGPQSDRLVADEAVRASVKLALGFWKTVCELARICLKEPYFSSVAKCGNMPDLHGTPGSPWALCFSVAPADLLSSRQSKLLFPSLVIKRG